MAETGDSLWRRLRGRVTGSAVQAGVVEANDGIVATAGLLEGFAGAGAGDVLLITAASAATIAGALSAGGAKWAEEAAERDAQLATIAYERRRLELDPDEERAELVAYYRERGLSPEVAEQVADQLSAHDALSAQLETEYGIDEVPSARGPVLAGIGAGLAFGIGASIPLAITALAPLTVDALAVLIAVVISLVVTSLVAARSARHSAPRMIIRSLVVGLGTLGVSYLAGLVLLPPAG